MAKTVNRKAATVKKNGATDKPPAESVNGAIKQWPADRVERLKVDGLIGCVRNARLHSETQIGVLAKAIERYGFTNPVIVDEAGELIAGHARTLAAKRLGLTEVPGIVIRDGEWTEEDRRSYVIFDNASALQSTWDLPMLEEELTTLKLANYPMELTGFPEAKLEMAPVAAGSPPKSPKKKATIFVTVPTKRMDEAKNAMAKALTAAGIDHNL